MNAFRTADGCLKPDMARQMGSWSEYFEQLCTLDPPFSQLPIAGLQTADGDPSIDEDTPTCDEVREPVARMRGENAAGICNITVDLAKVDYMWALMFYGSQVEFFITRRED